MARLKNKEEIILTAAFETFIEKGFSNSSMKDIAAKAGLGKGTLYEYFKNKDDLFIKVLQHKAENIVSDIRERVNVKRSVVEKLNEVIWFSQDSIKNTGFFFRFMIAGEFFELADEYKKLLRKILFNIRLRIVDIYKGIFLQGIEDGTLRDFDVELVSSIIPEMIGAHLNISAHVSSEFGEIQSIDMDEIREKIIGLIMYGIASGKKN